MDQQEALVSTIFCIVAEADVQSRSYRRLKEHLATLKIGTRVVLQDRSTIPAGDHIQETTYKILQEAQLVLVITSEQLANAQDCLEQITFARQQRKRLIEVKLRPHALTPPELANLQPFPREKNRYLEGAPAREQAGICTDIVKELTTVLTSPVRQPRVDTSPLGRQSSAPGPVDSPTLPDPFEDKRSQAQNTSPLSGDGDPSLPSLAPPSLRQHHHLRAHLLTACLTMVLTLAITFGSLLIVQRPHPPSRPPVVASSSGHVLKIGVDLPLSGEDFHDGQPVLNGIRLAVAQSSIPEYMLEVDVHNDLHDSVAGSRNVQEMVNDAQVAAIIGPFNSDVALAELSITNQASMAQLSPSTTSACLTIADVPASICKTPLGQLRPTGTTTFFRTSATNKDEGTKLADYLTRTLSYTNAAIINDPGAYGDDFAQQFASEWHADTGTTPAQRMLPSNTDQKGYEDVITQLAALKPVPNVVFYAGQEPNAMLIHTLMERNASLQTTAFAVGGGVMNPGFQTNVNDSQSGPVYAVAPIGSAFAPASNDGLSYYAGYLASYDDAPTVYAASAYDCTKIVIDALTKALQSTPAPAGPGDTNQARIFRQAVVTAIQDHISYDGVTGHYSFSNGSGDPDNGGTVALYHFDTISQRWVYMKVL